MKLSDLSCDYFEITKTQGEKTGEDYRHFPVKPGDCIIGDRDYSRIAGIEYIDQKGGFSMVRVNTQSLPFYTKQGDAINLLKQLSSITEAGSIHESNVFIKTASHQFIAGRLCVLRKSEYAIAKALKRLKKKLQEDNENYEKARWNLQNM